MVKALEFIVIGARKAGTSSLFEHLRVHPALYLPPAKDHPFFSDEAVYAAGWPEFVSRNFLMAPAEARWGTVTHHYMYGCPRRGNRAAVGATEGAEKIIPERIHAMFPDVKLIAILRDPVERCISDYGMSVLWGGQDRRSFDRTVADLLAPAALETSRRFLTHPFITWGEYGRILQPYYEVFPREQIFICFTDELSRAPLELMERLFRFLEVPRFVPPALQTRFRQAALSPRFGWLPSPVDLERRLATQVWARSLWRRLPPTVQKRILLRVRQLQYRFGLWNMRPGHSERPEASAEAVARLRAHYEPDRVLLEELIGKPVPWAPGQGSLMKIGIRTA